MFRRLMVSLARFMQGRYGTDHLNRFLLVLYFVVWGITSFVRDPLAWRILSLISSAVAFWLLYRTLSRNIPRRQAENQRFLRWWSPVGVWFGRQRLRLRDIRRCRYRRCPGCGAQLRLPIKR
jgi:hypothetical protein